ncbi:tetratricopeptide repeat-containing sensor histidine kinase [Fluviicola taffensis]|uniref:Signal transduction histidine kinase, LytS n=1 Tax=Fluviicola taffensis (strain DSM 16823 / NCIMB 13979 / RW262) TaxID=755732 RepID=F2IEE7_FLUTR|nr:histidine kinase [Fluviicola taffensis]AEA43471.1 signal transduction histidine kinase, LytS [Fluviicola taffensis DSM 16823]
MRFIICFLFVGIAGLLHAQSTCSCEPMQEYITKRDFDSTVMHSPINLWKLAKSLDRDKNARCQAFSFQLKAQVQIKNGQFDDAQKSLEREKFILDSIHCKTASYIENYLRMGELLMLKGDYETSIDSYRKTLRTLQKAGNNAMLSRAYIGLAGNYGRLKDKDKIKYYTHLAHPLVITLSDNESKIDLLSQLSSRYYKLFQLEKNKDYLDSALNMVTFANALARKVNYSESYLEIYNLLEDHAYYTRNFRLALNYLDSALLQTDSKFHWKERGAIYGDMSDIYLELKRYDKAYQFADSNLVYAQKTGDPYDVTNALELLYNCAKLSGEYERALVVYEDLSKMKDSVLKIQNARAFSQLEDKYHRVRKEKSDAEYEQDKRLLQQQQQIGNLKWRLILVGSIIFALLTAYVLMVFRQKTIKQKQKRLEIQHRLNRARINPDFIYNALNQLQNEGLNQTSDYKKQIQAFSKLLKQVLDSTHDDFMTLDREIEFLTFYLTLQRERSKNAFNFSFDIDEQLDPSNICLPTMILQPFVESTVLDGFSNLSRIGELTIRFKLKGLNELAIIIDDNGKGLKAIDSSRASEIINDRLYLLNKLHKSSSSYLIREKTGGGVSVEIYIPLITKAYAEELKKEGF